MLVLLVAPDHVAVDDVVSLEDGPPPPSLILPGPDVIVDANVHRGPDLVYRLAGRANLDSTGVLGRFRTTGVPAGVDMVIDDLLALPVYVELAPGELVDSGPVAGARPHLAAVPDVPPEPGVPTWSEPPTFSADGVAAAIGLGALVEGQVIRLAGMADPAMDCEYVVGVIRPGPGGEVDTNLVPLRVGGEVDGVAALRAEAERARAEAERIRATEPQHAVDLLDAAVGYERRAEQLEAAAAAGK